MSKFKRTLDKAMKALDETSYDIVVKRKSDGRKSTFKTIAETKSEAFKKAIKQATEEFGGKESDFSVVDYVKH